MGVNRKFDFRQVWKFCWDLSNVISGGNWLFRWDCVFSSGTLYPSANYEYRKAHNMDKLDIQKIQNQKVPALNPTDVFGQALEAKHTTEAP